MTAHSETRAVPYSARQMYDLVAAVETYPTFLPWIAGARVRSRQDKGDHIEMRADLIVSFKLFRERYGSIVRLYGPDQYETPRVSVENLDGMFRKLQTDYTFHPRPDGGCDMQFAVEFEFRNALLQRAGGLFFDQAMRSVVKAFEKRAEALYSAPL